MTGHALRMELVTYAASDLGAGTVTVITQGAENRSKWRYPLIGAAAGAVAGAIYGTYVMTESDDWAAPPAHFATIPIGAAIGASLGLVANVIDPP